MKRGAMETKEIVAVMVICSAGIYFGVHVVAVALSPGSIPSVTTKERFWLFVVGLGLIIGPFAAVRKELKDGLWQLKEWFAHLTGI